MVGGTEFSVVRLGDESKAAAVYAGIEALRAGELTFAQCTIVSPHCLPIHPPADL